jgi:hypothetical protein
VSRCCDHYVVRYYSSGMVGVNGRLFVCLCMCVCVDIHIYIYTYIHTSIQAHKLYTLIFLNMTIKRMCIYTYIHMHAHPPCLPLSAILIFTHTHINTQIPVLHSLINLIDSVMHIIPRINITTTNIALSRHEVVLRAFDRLIYRRLLHVDIYHDGIRAEDPLLIVCIHPVRWAHVTSVCVDELGMHVITR